MERERDQLSVTTDTSIISTASLFAQLVLAILAMQAQRHDDSSTAVDVIGTLVLHVAESLQIHTDIGHLQGGCGDGVWASQLNEIYSGVIFCPQHGHKESMLAFASAAAECYCASIAHDIRRPPESLILIEPNSKSGSWHQGLSRRGVRLVPVRILRGFRV